MSVDFDRLNAALSGRYAIGCELGRGGIGTVYLADDLRQRRRVAVKVLRREVSAGFGAERFLREIQAAASLSHPHILPLYDSGQAESVPYYVMPYVEGETLRERLRRERRLPIDEAVRIARHVADGLGYAHRHRVLHRDIKPENIFVSEGHAVISDFGISHAISVSAGGRLTVAGIHVGSLTYMSPEQAGGERDLDGRTDLYSLGCVLHEMLAGAPPYIGTSILESLKEGLPAEPTPLRLLNAAVPPLVEWAVTKALMPDREERFQSAAEFAESLLQVPLSLWV